MDICFWAGVTSSAPCVFRVRRINLLLICFGSSNTCLYAVVALQARTTPEQAVVAFPRGNQINQINPPWTTMQIVYGKKGMG